MTFDDLRVGARLLEIDTEQHDGRGGGVASDPEHRREYAVSRGLSTENLGPAVERIARDKQLTCSEEILTAGL